MKRNGKTTLVFSSVGIVLSRNDEDRPKVKEETRK